MEEETKDSLGLSEENKFCFHCGLPSRLFLTYKIAGELKNFCCNGCRTACQLIYASGAQSYYQNRVGYSENPVKIESKSLPASSENFQKTYIETNGSSQKITLHLQNFHCPSCVWVIEKVLENNKGLQEIAANYTTKRLKITWNKNLTSLEEIIETLAKVGYPASLVEKNNYGEQLSENNKTMLIRLVVAFFGMFVTMFLSEPFYFKSIQDLDPQNAARLQYLSMLLSTPVYFFSIVPFFRGMIATISFGIFNMNSSIFIAATAIYLSSVWGTIKGFPAVYFDCLTMFLALILLGRFIETNIQQKIFYTSEQALKKYPRQATIVLDGEEKVIHISDISAGDLLLVKPGEYIPADGVVTEGKTKTNESLLTGESKPVPKNEGDTVLGGSTNLEGVFSFKVIKPPSEATFSRIIKMIEEINDKKHPFQNTADRIAHYFIVVIFFLALGVYLLNAKNNPDQALFTAISVLIVSCPCAIGLAMPVSFSLAGFVGLKNGILFRNPESLEKLGKVKNFVFDKTGTLTTGKMTVEKVVTKDSFSENELLEYAAAVERYSDHPVAWAIVAESSKKKVKIRKAQEIIYYPGEGITGMLDKQKIILGNRSFLKNNGVKEIEKIADTVVFLAIENELKGYFLLNDNLRENAVKTIEVLRSKGIKFALISGDQKKIVENIAQKLNIKDFAGEVLPERKVSHIQALKKENSLVAMIGDGINDAPAMAMADVGIALSSGNELADSRADLIILNKDLKALLKARNISIKTFRTIKQNFLISFLYNMIVIPLAVLGYITPLLAALLMPLSSLIVVLNSLKILRKDG